MLLYLQKQKKLFSNSNMNLQMISFLIQIESFSERIWSSYWSDFHISHNCCRLFL